MIFEVITIYVSLIFVTVLKFLPKLVLKFCLSAMESLGENSKTQATDMSKKIHDVLKHYEAPILHVQRLLVWEDYIYSSIFVAMAHVCFYYLFLRSNHFFGMFFFLLMIFVWIDCWKHRIWPEIRAVAPDIDSEWGELNPRLLSIKEMCDYLASFLVFIIDKCQQILEMRRDKPQKFCLTLCFCCLVFMYVGQKVHGALIMYLLFSIALLWPVLWYHRILENTYRSMEPFFMQLQYTLQQRPGNTYQMAQSMAGQSPSIVDANDDIEEFVPVLDEKTAAVLAKAITDESELSETDEEILAQELPLFSQIAAHSDNEAEDNLIPWPNDINPLNSLLKHGDNSSVSVPTNFVTDVGNAGKDSFFSVAQSMQQEKPIFSDQMATDSKASTPCSEFDFVVLNNDSDQS